MQTSNRLTVAVFGERDTVTDDISVSWSKASIELEGPISAASFVGKAVSHFSAALIDVRYTPEVMMPLMEALEATAIPFIFFVPAHMVATEAGPFILSSKHSDILDILQALSSQHIITRH